MLLPMLREDLFDQLNQHGIDRGISKPVIPSVLLNEILNIFNSKEVPTSQSSASRKASLARPDKSYQVLLAEDNKTNQLIAMLLLEREGIKTIIANDGQEAVKKFIEHQDSLDLILMDLHMPVMRL